MHGRYSGKHRRPTPSRNIHHAPTALLALTLPAALAASYHAPAASNAGHLAAMISPPAPQPSAWPVKAQAAAVTASQLGTYTVRPGDTLAGISAKLLGSADRWPDLWWWNRSQVKNPNVITTGQVLRVYSWRVPYASWEPWVTAQADAAIPKPPPVVTTAAVSGDREPDGDGDEGVPQGQAQVPQQVPQPAAALSGPWPGGAFGNCVVSRESGGNPQVMNSSGHYGLYQFSYSTWVAYGGNPGSFGNASVGEQEQVFLNAMSHPGGASNWSPYDGC